MNKLTIRDAEPAGRRLFLRVDFNVPLDSKGAISDDTRIQASLPTIRYGIEHGAKLILASHLGRPKGQPVGSMTLRPAAERLAELVRSPVAFANDCVGPEVEAQARGLAVGGVLLLENLRFHPEEEKNEEGFSRRLAALADLYVNDAFGSAHRAHASTVGITKYLAPALAGFLMEREINYLSKAVENPARPYTAIVGGAKVSDKMELLQNLMKFADNVLIGGAMAYTFLKARGVEVGKSRVEDDKLELARNILSFGERRSIRIRLPEDHVVLHQVSLQGSATVPESDGTLEMPVAARAGTDAVPTHYLMAFGPRARELRPAAGVAQVDLEAQRRWERQRESDLAVFEDLEQRYRETYERLRATIEEREEFRRYIHDLEGRLGLPRSGDAEPQPALPDASA